MRTIRKYYDENGKFIETINEFKGVYSVDVDDDIRVIKDIEVQTLKLQDAINSLQDRWWSRTEKFAKNVYKANKENITFNYDHNDILTCRDITEDI